MRVEVLRWVGTEWLVRVQLQAPPTRPWPGKILEANSIQPFVIKPRSFTVDHTGPNGDYPISLLTPGYCVRGNGAWAPSALWRTLRLCCRWVASRLPLDTGGTLKAVLWGVHEKAPCHPGPLQAKQEAHSCEQAYCK